MRIRFFNSDGQTGGPRSPWSYHVPETISFDLKKICWNWIRELIVTVVFLFIFFLPQSENVSALSLDARKHDFIGGEDSSPPVPH
jgi:hypothetical protein